MVPVRHQLALLATALAVMSGCVVAPDGAGARSCQGQEAGPGDLQVHVYPRAEHLEHTDWAAATEKDATITPYVDNGTNRYVEDETRLPAVTGPLDGTDCVVFHGIEPGWWEIRASARADESGCSWYGGSGKMVLVEPERVLVTGFQPTLACA